MRRPSRTYDKQESATRAARTCCAILTLLSALCFCSCGEKPLPTPEPVTIVFGFPERFLEETYQQLAQDFHNLYPHITVTLQRDFRADRADLSSGSAPDTFLAAPDSTLFEGGNVLDFLPLLEQDPQLQPDDFFPRVLDTYRRRDKLWATPAEVDMLVMCYNKDLFDALAVPYPSKDWTWTDFLQATKDIVRESRGSVYGFASNPISPEIVPFIYQHGGTLVDDMQEPSRFYMDDPLSAEAIQWYADLSLVHEVMPSPSQMSSIYPRGPIEGFVTQRAAMYMGTLTDRGGTASGVSWPFRWGAVVLPRDAERCTLLTTRGYFIKASTAHPNESAKWITYLSSQPAPWVLSPRRSVAESSGTAERLGAELAAVALESVGFALPPFTVDPSFWQVGEWFVEGVVLVVEGRVTAPEMMYDLKPKIDQFLQEQESSSQSDSG